MTDDPDTQSEPTPGRRRRKAQPPPSITPTADPEARTDPAAEEDIAGELSFREAQTALELSLTQLQSPDLDVEEMAGLYRRARRYADRCEELLQRVEQEVMQWDPEQPEEPPQPYGG